MVHLGFIPDGNRRWCRKHKKALIVENLKAAWLGHLCHVARDCPGAKPSRWKHLACINELSLYVCSIDNVRRSDDTMTAICEFLREVVPTFVDWRNQLIDGAIQVNVIGSIHELEPDVRDLLRKLSDLYESVDPLFTLNLAVAYDYEADVRNHGVYTDPEYDTRRVSQLDMVVRTGGDQRLSGFFPTKTFYAELFFLKKFWPEMDLDGVDAAVRKLLKRERRFGA